MKHASIQTEIDAAFLYERLAAHEKDPVIARIFRQMSEIEQGHAHAFAQRHGLNLDLLPGPSWHARALDRIGSLFGYDTVLGVLMDTEKSISNAIVRTKQRKQEPVSGHEANHVRILRSILEKEARVSGTQLTRFEKRHRTVGGNAIRAAVLGGNDGLVSNFSLVMGVAGASGNENTVLVTGLAGLMAGALSMALGEWISVKSSQELYERQMALELEEIQTNPEGEKQELALIYMAKGIPDEQARAMAAKTMENTEYAHEVLVKEELGINAEELKGSAMEAAVSSFILFGIGAIIPVLPFFFSKDTQSILLSVAFSAFGLFLIGAAITLFTGRSVWLSGLRQVLFGLTAAAITFGIGKLIGVSIG